MAGLTDAELVLGLSRHLAAYSMGPHRVALSELEFAGQLYDIAFRLRGSTTSPANRLRAIGADVGVDNRRLREIVATMEVLGWLTVDRNEANQVLFVTETMSSVPGLISESDRVFACLDTGPLEIAALTVIRATTIQPLVLNDALEKASDAGADQAASEQAIRHLVAINVIKTVSMDDGREVLYNPNVWVQGDEIAAAAIRAADARATNEVASLIEEVSACQALPETHVRSTEPRWIKFAVAQGLIQRSVIQTTEGVEQAFLFTPHVARDTFGGTAGDASGHVRQLVGSMVYASTFARTRLRDPRLFLGRLISDGEAGNATPIGSDYMMLEKAGVVRVVPSYGGRYRMQLLQSDVAEDAMSLIEQRYQTVSGGVNPSSLSGQSGYIHIDTDRARLATVAETDQLEQARLVSALRDISVRRTLGA